MKKYYQTDDRRVSRGRVTPRKPRQPLAEVAEDDDLPAWALPESVQLSLADLAGTVREGLLAFAVATGLEVMYTMMDADVEALCGPKGRHDAGRAAYRHGADDGEVSLGGRRVPVRRPRARSADGKKELPLPTYQAFSSTELLGAMALEKMMAKVSTRRYRAGLEPVGKAVEAASTSTSKSSVSRRFVKATEERLGQLMGARLSGLDLVALLIDGVHFGEHLCVVALGVGMDGLKHPLGVVEGSTENATVVKDLLVGLRERGLDVTKPVLVVIDGAKALSSAVGEVFDHPVVQRCQVHKLRNVKSHLPQELGNAIASKMRAAYRLPSALAAEAKLEAIAKELGRSHPGAAGSLREGLEETLTVTRLGVHPSLARCLRSTNSIVILSRPRTNASASSRPRTAVCAMLLQRRSAPTARSLPSAAPLANDLRQHSGSLSGHAHDLRRLCCPRRKAAGQSTFPRPGLKITIESMIEICRDHSANVKNWSSGDMALRWCAAGMVEAKAQFRRVDGYRHLPALRSALEAEAAARQAARTCGEPPRAEAAA